MTAGQSLAPLFAPRSVAIVGASSEPTRIGGRPIAYMKERGFKGLILPVNPNRTEIQGLRCYQSVAALPEAPDIGIVAVPGADVARTIEDLGSIGTKAAVIFSAGFAEMGDAGAALQAELVASARRHGMRILGPNCLGLFNDSIGYYATFAGAFQAGWPRAGGRIGLVSQSGAYGMHLFVAARDRGIGTSFVCTTGNEADITIGEVMSCMVENDAVDVIAVFAEGIRNPEAFLAALEAAQAARKPVVLMKVGRTAQGRAAALSHTGALATDDAVLQAVLDEFGVVRAHSSEQFLDIAHLATRGIFPRRRSLAVVTISGGAGVLASDAAADAGLSMPQISPAGQARFREVVPFCSAQNPVDLTGQIGNNINLIGDFTRLMMEEGDYGSVFAFFGQIGGFKAPAVRSQLSAVMQDYPGRLVVLSVSATPEQLAAYEDAGFICINDPNRAVTAIAAMCRFGESFARERRPLESAGAFPLPDVSPNEAEAKRLLRGAGIETTDERICRTIEQAVTAAEELGYPVVLKILSPGIFHKSEIGGVLTGIGDAAAVRAGFETLVARLHAARPAAVLEGILVARQVEGGVECCMGIARDPLFGPVAMFGLGGIFVEVLNDLVFRRCPFDEVVAREMILAIRGAAILQGARGGRPVDIPALAAMLSRLSVLAHQAGPALQSIDLNPVFAMPQGGGAIAADAVIQVQPQ